LSDPVQGPPIHDCDQPDSWGGVDDPGSDHPGHHVPSAAISVRNQHLDRLVLGTAETQTRGGRAGAAGSVNPPLQPTKSVYSAIKEPNLCDTHSPFLRWRLSLDCWQLAARTSPTRNKNSDAA